MSDITIKIGADVAEFIAGAVKAQAAAEKLKETTEGTARAHDKVGQSVFEIFKKEEARKETAIALSRVQETSAEHYERTNRAISGANSGLRDAVAITTAVAAAAAAVASGYISAAQAAAQLSRGVGGQARNTGNDLAQIYSSKKDVESRLPDILKGSGLATATDQQSLVSAAASYNREDSARGFGNPLLPITPAVLDAALTAQKKYGPGALPGLAEFIQRPGIGQDLASVNDFIARQVASRPGANSTSVQREAILQNNQTATDYSTYKTNQNLAENERVYQAAVGAWEVNHPALSGVGEALGKIPGVGALGGVMARITWAMSQQASRKTLAADSRTGAIDSH